MCRYEDGLTTTAPPPLSPERLRALAREAWKLEPPMPHERKDLLRSEAGMLLDGLLVEVARSSGAIDVAIGEGLAALCSGDGPMRLGYSGIGDYARENLSIAGRTAYELAKLARELRSRPLLREDVRRGEVSVKQAEAILKVAVGEAEAGWVARAKRETVAELKAAVKGNDAGSAEEEERWNRFTLRLEDPDRAVVDEALALGAKLLGQASPRWQRVEVICQEYLGEHPAPERHGCPRRRSRTGGRGRSRRSPGPTGSPRTSASGSPASTSAGASSASSSPSPRPRPAWTTSPGRGRSTPG